MMSRIIASCLELFSAVYFLMASILLFPGALIIGFASRLREDDKGVSETFEEAATRLAGTNDHEKVAVMMRMMR